MQNAKLWKRRREKLRFLDFLGGLAPENRGEKPAGRDQERN
jgi:hypothetical protein